MLTVVIQLRKSIGGQRLHVSTLFGSLFGLGRQWCGAYGDPVEMQAHKRVGIRTAELNLDTIGQVAALRAILCVSEHARHEMIPEGGCCRGADWFAFRLGRKTKSRQRRYNYVERIFRRTAITCRVAQRPDSF